MFSTTCSHAIFSQITIEWIENKLTGWDYPLDKLSEFQTTGPGFWGIVLFKGYQIVFCVWRVWSKHVRCCETWEKRCNKNMSLRRVKQHPMCLHWIVLYSSIQSSITCTSETNFSAGYIFRVASIVVGLFIICILLASKVAFMSSLTNTKFLLDVLLSSFFIVEQCSLTVSSVSPLLLLVGWSFFLIHFDWLLVPGLQVSLLLGLFPLLRFLNRFFIACSHDD